MNTDNGARRLSATNGNQALEIIFPLRYPCHFARMCSNIRGVPRIIRISGHATRFTALSYKRPGESEEGH